MLGFGVGNTVTPHRARLGVPGPQEMARSSMQVLECPPPQAETLGPVLPPSNPVKQDKMILPGAAMLASRDTDACPVPGSCTPPGRSLGPRQVNGLSAVTTLQGLNGLIYQYNPEC